MRLRKTLIIANLKVTLDKCEIKSEQEHKIKQNALNRLVFHSTDRP